MRNRGNPGMDAVYALLYRLAAGFCLTASYVKKVKATLQALCPCEERRLRKQTMKICMAVWVIVFCVFTVLFFRSPDIYMFLLSILYSVVLSKEMLRFVSGSIGRKILLQTEKMLSDVRHYYYDTHSIISALQEALSDAGYEMRVHIGLLINVLTAENKDDAVETYNRSTENRFLKLFLSQCIAIQEYGDAEKDGESLFARNLTNLKSDIVNHLLQLDRLRSEFAGLMFISLTPLLVLPLIRTTAILSLPELSGFYEGTFGRVLPVIYLVTTILIYSMIVEMQELDVRSKKGGWLWKAEKIRYISYLLDFWERGHYGKIVQQTQRLRKNGEHITPRLLFMKKVLYLGITIVAGIVVLIFVKSKEEFISWYEAGMILLFGILAFLIPELQLRYREALMRMNMMTEVTQFQSIVIMQMFIPDITVLRMLTTIEQFAYIFRTSIRDCINEYSYSVQMALQGMKQAESFEPFRRLCDNFLIVDKIGIVRAFEEIAQDQLHFQKQREEDTCRMISRKAGYARIIAFIPMMLIIISYLILPYGIEAIRQFNGIIQKLGAL